MPAIVQLEDHVSNFDHLVDGSFWAECGTFTAYPRTAPDEVVPRAKEAEILLINKTVISEPLLSRLPKLKYIGVLATGYNVVDLDSCRGRGVAVTNVPAYSTESVVQLVFAHLLNLVRQAEFHARYDWSTSPDFTQVLTPQIDLWGKTLGIAGFGAIGSRVAEVAAAFGMKVAVWTRTPAKAARPGIRVCATLEEMLEISDAVTLHCPLFKETARMIDARTIARMKPGAFLINTSRGGLIDEQALLEALDSGRIAGAGLDVLSTEPPPPDHPLLHHPKCRITPHIAWATREARMRLFTAARENLRSFLAGGSLNRLV